MDRKQLYRGVMTVFLFGTLFQFAACSNTVRVDNNHVVYRYDLPKVSVSQYTPGSTITLKWQAVVTNDSTPYAYPIILTASLTKGRDSKSGVLDSATITTNNWDGRNYVMTIHIAKNVPFGNYYLTQSSTIKATNAFETTKSGGTFITVQSS